MKPACVGPVLAAVRRAWLPPTHWSLPRASAGVRQLCSKPNALVPGERRPPPPPSDIQPSPSGKPMEEGNIPVPGANRPRPPQFVVVSEEEVAAVEDLPLDLQLPVAGDPARRTAAGLIDAVVAAAVGGLVGTCVHLGVGVVEASEAAGVMAAAMAWGVRDALFDDGNRSLGKKLNKLEITYWDGTLAPRSECLKRNIYWLVIPFAAFHPLTNQLSHVFIVFDIASVLVTDDARKVGDYIAGTRVVNERPDRDTRLDDMHEIEEIKMLERRLAHLEHEQ